MKYRIKQVNDIYYPQIKNLLGYESIKKFNYQSNCIYYTDIFYYSLYEAKQFLDELIKEDIKKLSFIKIHEYPRVK